MAFNRTVDHIAALVIIAVIVYLLSGQPETRYVSVKDTDRDTEDRDDKPGPLRVLRPTG